MEDIKDLMAQFDQSSLREFSYQNGEQLLSFSKNEQSFIPATPIVEKGNESQFQVTEVTPTLTSKEEVSRSMPIEVEGELVESPLVGVAYLSPAPDKPTFVSVGDTVKKGQTLLIVEAMKVMNEVPSPKDGVVTEILVANEDVVDFGKGLVRIK